MNRPSHYTAWTAEQDDHLRRRYPDDDTEALAAALGRARTAIYARAGMLGLGKSEAAIARIASKKSRGRSLWNDALDEILSLMYPDHCSSHIEALTGIDINRISARANTLGLHKTKAFLAETQRQRMAGNPGAYASKRFQPGHDSWNKGMKGLQIGGKETRFAKGNVPHTSVPIGTERWTTPGRAASNPRPYLRRKVAEPDTWRFVHQLIWEAAHGPIPPSHVVRFKSGDTTDLRLDNLFCISRSDNSRLNSPWRNLPRELAELVNLRGQLTRQTNRALRSIATQESDAP